MNMIRNKIALYGLVMGIVLMIIPFLSIVLFADSKGSVITIDATDRDIIAIENTIKEINEDIIEKLNIVTELPDGSVISDNNSFNYTISGSVINISINNTIYNKLEYKYKEKFMQIALSDIQNSGISVINRNKLYTFVANSDPGMAGIVRQLSEDVSVDMPAAYAFVKPFSGWVGLILGCFTILIFAMLGLSTIIDISFLTIPGIQWILISKNAEQDKPKLVSLEAWESYKEVQQTHGQVLATYFKRKVGQFCVLGVCVLYLVSGNLFALVAKIIDYFQGVIQVFTK